MAAKVRKGEAIQDRLTPHLRKAVISLLRDRSPREQRGHEDGEVE
jgi:hypothetical protein